MQPKEKGFTLLELLIVIAILAILSAVTVIVLNPAEILKKSRDSQRISDLSTMKTAIGYYIVSTSSAVLGTNSSTGCQNQTTPSTYSHVSSVVAPSVFTTSVTTTSRAVDGTGWIKVKLSELSGGSPLGAWPIDPNPSAATASGDLAHYYAYVCKDDLTFTLFANMESGFYKNTGAGDAESQDGGSLAGVREDGTVFGLVTAVGVDFYTGN